MEITPNPTPHAYGQFIGEKMQPVMVSQGYSNLLEVTSMGVNRYDFQAEYISNLWQNPRMELPLYMMDGSENTGIFKFDFNHRGDWTWIW